MHSANPIVAGSTRPKRRALARSGFCALLAVAAVAASAGPGRAEEQLPLRLCADPTNLPFSSDSPAQPGFYLEIGQAIAQALGRPVTYDWYKSYFGKRTVRVTLLGRHCDAMVGLPRSEDFMGPAVIFSRTFVTESYALVTANELTIAGINDLKGKRVAVQFSTTPQNLLAERNDVQMVTVLSPEAGMKALDQGKADVAFIWGPVAGWLNKTSYGNRYRIQPTEGAGLSWDAAIGFAKASKQLRDQVDAALPGIEQKILELSAKYGLPTASPIRIGATRNAIRFAALETRIMSDLAPSGAAAAVSSSEEAVPRPAMRVADAASAKPPAAVNAGKEIFNGTCAHCHGPDAVQSERKIDLRLLNNRYGEDMRARFMTTVNEGRPSKGMPAWNEVFTEDQFESIYAYLLTVQAPADTTN
ncbi:c-type cytochrome [Bradyrhizobium sp.]|uniref:c-type cytochrome n=1 Tax=Bradyrhizobium sp. TaxID=376 RepID=UPI0040380859